MSEDEGSTTQIIRQVVTTAKKTPVVLKWVIGIVAALGTVWGGFRVVDSYLLVPARVDAVEMHLDSHHDSLTPAQALLEFIEEADEERHSIASELVFIRCRGERNDAQRGVAGADPSKATIDCGDPVVLREELQRRGFGHPPEPR